MSETKVVSGTRLKILLAAEESAGTQLLRALAAGPHEIAGVLARQPAHGATGTGVWQLAQKMGLATWDARQVRDSGFAATLASLDLDVMLNVHSLYIIRPEILETARYGGFNLHPGPLPRYAGLNAPSWAIYRGERQHGVTLHRMDGGIDTGPIVFQELFGIEPTDNALTLSAKCVRAGLPLVHRLLEILARDPASLPLQAMAPGTIEYFGREIPQDGRLSWQASATEILNFIRACDYYPFPSPWGHPAAALDGRRIGLVRAAATGNRAADPPGTVCARAESGAEIACPDETIMISHVELDGRYAAAGDILSPGQRLGDGQL